jgi:hypothetical protein
MTKPMTFSLSLAAALMTANLSFRPKREQRR